MKLFSLRTKPPQSGGVVLEYLLITLFSTILSLTLLGVAAHIFQEKIEHFAAEAGVSLQGIRWNPFADVDAGE